MMTMGGAKTPGVQVCWRHDDGVEPKDQEFTGLTIMGVGPQNLEFEFAGLLVMNPQDESGIGFPGIGISWYIPGICPGQPFPGR
jgi:hypothetical protein